MRRVGMLMLMLCLPGLAWAQVHALPSAPHILVKGHAQGDYVPDRFTIHLSINVVDKVPDTARRRVEVHVEHILAALKKTGALEKRTRASSLEISPDYEYRDQHRVFVGTQVTRDIRATFDSLLKLRNFIAKVKASKELQINNTKVGRSDISEIRMLLRKQAIANSREAAKRLAAAYGVHVKGLYSVSEVAPDFAYGIHAGSWTDRQSSLSFSVHHASAPSAPPPDVIKMVSPPPRLETGTIRVQMDMYAVYLIGSAATSGH